MDGDIGGDGELKPVFHALQILGTLDPAFVIHSGTYGKYASVFWLLLVCVDKLLFA